MPEPLTIAAAAIGGLGWWLCQNAGGAALGGALGNTTDRAVRGMLRSFRNRTAGLRGLPENHDVARAVRTAQMQALEKLICDYKDIGRPEWRNNRLTYPDFFFDRSLAFCAETIGRYRLGSGVKPNLEITAPLGKAIDGILDPPEGDRPAARRAAEIARLAEDAVLDELRERLGEIVLPVGFETHFRDGNAGRRRFLDLFGSFIAEQIKDDDRFRAILQTGRLSRIEGLAYDTAAILTQGFARVENRLDGMEDANERRHREVMEALARDKGVDPQHLVPLFEHFGQAGLTLDEIRNRAPELIEETLARARQPVERSNDGADIDATIGTARAPGRTRHRGSALGPFGENRRGGNRPAATADPAAGGTGRDRTPVLRPRGGAGDVAQTARARPRSRLAWIDLGDSFVVTGSLPDAAEAYSRAQEAARRTGDERDLSVSQEKIGDVQRAQGDLAAALTSYQASLRIAERLAQADALPAFLRRHPGPRPAPQGQRSAPRPKRVAAR
jgi:tetratricopeptide (TPR) repeat protein